MGGRLSQVRFGVIGVGSQGSAHCNAIGKMSHATLAGVVDSDPEWAREIGSRFGVPAFESHEALIESSVCDAVVIATPHTAHVDPAMDSLNAGLHVFCEKPVSERISTAREMVALASEKGVAFSVNLGSRLSPERAKAIEIVRSGRIGRLVRGMLVFQEYRSQAYYDSGGWRATWKGEGGGVLLNQAPHLLDFFLQLTGLPEKVLGFAEARLHDIEVEDCAEAVLRFPGGGTGYLHATTNELNLGRTIEIVGDQGYLALRGGKVELYEYEASIGDFTRANEDKWASPTCRRVPFRKPKGRRAGVLANFVAHLVHGDALGISGQSALWSLEVANAITLSADEERWVPLPLDGGAYDRCLERKQRASTFQKRQVAEDRTTDPGGGARSALRKPGRRNG